MIKCTLAVVVMLGWAWIAPTPSSDLCPGCPRRLEPDAPAPLQCDGTPPELNNQDQQSYEFELTCGKKKERLSISAQSKKSLKKKAGCTIKLGKNKETKLFADMVCVIKAAKLSCDLL